jgi:uncharacterized membrane protein YtjA (UPF0391 family)
MVKRGALPLARRLLDSRVIVFVPAIPHPATEVIMLGAAIGLLILALIAAVLGFGGIAGAAAGLAKIAFFVFLVLAVVGFFMGRVRTA